MPRLSPTARARILERLVLKALGGEPGLSSVLEQQFAIGGDEVRHFASLPHVPMKPEATIHRVNHPLSA